MIFVRPLGVLNRKTRFYRCCYRRRVFEKVRDSLIVSVDDELLRTLIEFRVVDEDHLAKAREEKVDQSLSDVGREGRVDRLPQALGINDLLTFDGLVRVLLQEMRRFPPHRAYANGLDLKEGVTYRAIGVPRDIQFFRPQRHLSIDETATRCLTVGTLLRALVLPPTGTDNALEST